MRPHSRYSVSSRAPRARACCDRCYREYNHDQLKYQFQWQGTKLQNLKILVCRECLDVPQEQLRTIIIPADPIPIMDPRPPTPIHDVNPISAIGTPIGTLTGYAGLAAAFDASENKPFTFCAGTYPDRSAVGPPSLNYSINTNSMYIPLMVP